VAIKKKLNKKMRQKLGGEKKRKKERDDLHDRDSNENSGLPCTQGEKKKKATSEEDPKARREKKGTTESLPATTQLEGKTKVKGLEKDK